MDGKRKEIGDVNEYEITKHSQGISENKLITGCPPPSHKKEVL